MLKQFNTLFQMVLASLLGKICKSSKKLDLGLAHRLTMRAGMYSLRLGELCRFEQLRWSLLEPCGGSLASRRCRGCSESPPRGIQVGGLPRVASKLPVANVATSGKQEIDDLGTLIETKL